MTKTICFVNTHYFPVLGGITQYTYNLIRELKKQNINIIIITLNVVNLDNYEKNEFCEIYRLPCYKFMDGRFPALKLNKQSNQTIEKIFKKKIDLMVINARFYPLSLYMAKIAKTNAVYSILIDHGSSHLSMSNVALTKCGEIYEHIVTRFVKKYCKNFYGVSEASCEWLKHFGIQAKGILYNAVDIEFINDIIGVEEKKYKKQYHLYEEDKIVTFTGRLVKEKGILNLTEAILNIRKTNPNIYLFVAGEGPLKEQLVNLNDLGIILLGQIELKKIICLLIESTVLCLPSKSEGFPTSVLEAVACKCFSIVTQVGGGREIIPSRKFGILLEENSVMEIEKAIRYVLENEEESKEVVENTYKRMIDNFTWKKTANKIVGILKSNH